MEAPDAADLTLEGSEAWLGGAAAPLGDDWLAEAVGSSAQEDEDAEEWDGEAAPSDAGVGEAWDAASAPSEIQPGRLSLTTDEESLSCAVGRARAPSSLPCGERDEAGAAPAHRADAAGSEEPEADADVRDDVTSEAAAPSVCSGAPTASEGQLGEDVCPLSPPPHHEIVQVLAPHEAVLSEAAVAGQFEVARELQRVRRENDRLRAEAAEAAVLRERLAVLAAQHEAAAQVEAENDMLRAKLQAARAEARAAAKAQRRLQEEMEAAQRDVLEARRAALAAKPPADMAEKLRAARREAQEAQAREEAALADTERRVREALGDMQLQLDLSNAELEQARGMVARQHTALLHINQAQHAERSRVEDIIDTLREHSERRVDGRDAGTQTDAEPPRVSLSTSLHADDDDYCAAGDYFEPGQEGVLLPAARAHPTSRPPLQPRPQPRAAAGPPSDEALLAKLRRRCGGSG
eukprot:TRINITY_DN19396_c0_g1_i1.p1 TRINITY_DN19396_c0_g1~~TRINITY_DN19396_c0_g1_i1.p1  ORF type:complete len:483 (+),score=201.43 TRINITY_DN19396_c0_g1_i1:55-1449(+)